MNLEEELAKLERDARKATRKAEREGQPYVALVNDHIAEQARHLLTLVEWGKTRDKAIKAVRGTTAGPLPVEDLHPVMRVVTGIIPKRLPKRRKAK